MTLYANDEAFYSGERIALGTRHGKQRQIAPAFAARLGAEVVVPPDLDTDRFGTFSGERPRSLTAPDAARAKARLAMDVLGLDKGLASEASYGPLPGLGWSGHEELLLFVDGERDIEVVEGIRGLAVPGVRQVVHDIAELRLEALGWPEQAVIVRPASAVEAASPGADPAGAGPPDVTKGISSLERLAVAVARAAATDPNGRVAVEPDLRAHHNPSRRAVLVQLAERLARRLATACPACRTPGFGRVGVEAGRRCGACGSATDQPLADVHGCLRCEHRQLLGRQDGPADPQWCPRCNP